MYHHRHATPKSCGGEFKIGGLTISSNGVLIQGNSNVSMFVSMQGITFNGPVFGLSNQSNQSNQSNPTPCVMCDGCPRSVPVIPMDTTNIPATHEFFGDVIVSDKLYVTDTLTVPHVDMDSLTVYNRSTCHSWNMFVSSCNDLEFRSKFNTLVTLCEEFSTGLLCFTGSHMLNVTKSSRFRLEPGHIVVSTGKYCDVLTGREGIHMDDALPIVKLSSEKCQNTVFGVFSRWEENRCFKLGNLRFPMPALSSSTPTLPLAQVNSAGEGCILVNSEEGDLRNGDLITTSSEPGVGCRQTDDVVRSYTVAKITCDCFFGEFGAQKRLVGCIYKF